MKRALILILQTRPDFAWSLRTDMKNMTTKGEGKKAAAYAQMWI